MMMIINILMREVVVIKVSASKDTVKVDHVVTDAPVRIDEKDDILMIHDHQW